MKEVELILSPPEPHYVGDGFRVHNFIPGAYRLDMYRMDPFIMFDYNSKHVFPPSDKPKGVGVHPHRGFETVTIAYKGKVAHHDSAGGGGIIGEGDVQWMTAASGVLHKEYHEEEFSKTGGEFQMVQLWVNLPSKDKMSTPKYQAIENARMQKIALENGGYIELIAGNYTDENGFQFEGPASTFSPVHLSNAVLYPQNETNQQQGSVANYSFPAHYNTALIVIEGEVLVNNEYVVPTDNFVLFANKGEAFTVQTSPENKGTAKVLVLSGEPLREPIAAHGPFVMNTRQELIQAFNDFNDGKFGFLED